MAINYTKKTWQNSPSTATPLSAANIQIMDNAIEAACDGVDAINDNLAKTSYNLNGYKDALAISASGTLNKSNGNVVMTGYVLMGENDFTAQSVTTVITLPVGLRPSIPIYAPCTLYASSIMQGGFIAIDTDGAVKVYNRSAETTYNSVAFSITFAV